MSDVAMSLIDDTSEMQIGDENSNDGSSARLSAQTAYLAKTLPTNGSDISEVYVLKSGTPEDRLAFIGARNASAPRTAVGLVPKSERLEIGCSRNPYQNLYQSQSEISFPSVSSS